MAPMKLTSVAWQFLLLVVCTQGTCNSESTATSKSSGSVDCTNFNTSSCPQEICQSTNKFVPEGECCSKCGCKVEDNWYPRGAFKTPSCDDCTCNVSAYRPSRNWKCSCNGNFQYKTRYTTKPPPKLVNLDTRSFLRTPAEQAAFAAEFERTRLQLTKVTRKVRSRTPCLSGCESLTSAVCYPPYYYRRERKALKDQLSYYQGRYTRQASAAAGAACCQTDITWNSPNTKTNVNGVTVTLYHEDPRRQYFPAISCRQVTGCRDCTCYQEDWIIPLVIVDGTGVSIDFFSALGCCNCRFT